MKKSKPFVFTFAVFNSEIDDYEDEGNEFYVDVKTPEDIADGEDWFTEHAWEDKPGQMFPTGLIPNLESKYGVLDISCCGEDFFGFDSYEVGDEDVQDQIECVNKVRDFLKEHGFYVGEVVKGSPQYECNG